MQAIICGIVLGEAESKDKVEKIANAFKECPYVNFIATGENKLFVAYFLPKEQLWWIEYIQMKPRETLGLKKAQVVIMEKVYYPQKLTINFPKEKSKLSPCGADCPKCPSYNKCLGCPATMYYKGVDF